MKFVFKWFKRITLFFILLFFLSLALVVSFAKWQRPIQQTDAIIVLGAAINTPALNNRTLHALSLYEKGLAKELVLSGGRVSDTDISEAGYMQKLILKNYNKNNDNEIKPLKGEELPRLILEESSRNSFENIRNSKEKIPTAQSVLVVSDEYHLARASFLAWRFGFKKVFWSSPNSDIYPKKELYFHYFRESVALIAYVPKFVVGK